MSVERRGAFVKAISIKMLVLTESRKGERGAYGKTTATFVYHFTK